GAQRTALPALADQSPLHRPALDLALLIEGLALAPEHRTRRPWPEPRLPDAPEPREPLAQWQLRILPGEHQQRRLRRPADARQRRSVAAAQFQFILQLPAAA